MSEKRIAVVDWTRIEKRGLLGRRYTAAIVDSPDDDAFVERFVGSWGTAVALANRMQVAAEKGAGRRLP